MQEKVDLKERVEELEHRCIQLSGETDTIGEWRGGGPGQGAEGWIAAAPHLSPVRPPRPAGEYIALYQSQRAVLKARHQEKEEYISRLAQDKEEMKVGVLVTVSVGGGGVGCGC